MQTARGVRCTPAEQGKRRPGKFDNPNLAPHLMSLKSGKLQDPVPFLPIHMPVDAVTTPRQRKMR